MSWPLPNEDAFNLFFHFDCWATAYLQNVCYKHEVQSIIFYLKSEALEFKEV